MPFRSEKQRRFLWAKHPEIAKEWAHKYPDSNKGLPMYAHDKKDEDQPVSKAAALTALNALVVNNLNSAVKSIFASVCDKNTKKADSKLEQIKLPQAPKPTYAGERKLESILKPETEDEGSIGQERSEKKPETCENMQSNPLLSKLAVVLAPKIQQEIENRRAQEEARNANRMPQNVNIKKYPVQNFNVPPPMGMTAPPQAPQAPQQPQQAQQAPQNGQLAPVGGGNSPNANPINSFGGLSSTGDINGNAALGTQNMAGGEKMAYGVWDEYGVAERTPYYDFKPADKLPAYLTRASELAAQKGYRLGFTNERYGESIPGKEYAEKLRKGKLPADYFDDEFPAFFDMHPMDTRSWWQKLLGKKYQDPKQTIDDLHGHNIEDDKAWQKHVDENWPVYRAYKEIYETPQPVGKEKAAWVTGFADGAFGEAMKAAPIVGGGLGALAGGAIGGIHGAISPGEYTDSDGNKKKRGRLMAALRGGAAGAGIGGLGGAAAGAVGAMPNWDTLIGQNKPVFTHKGTTVDYDDMGTGLLSGQEKRNAASKCSCGCGQKVNECTCPPSCSCRQKGGSCYGLKKQASGNNPALAKIMSISGEPIVDPAELDELESEMFDKTADSPAWQRSEGKNDEGGLNEKGRKSYEREHGGNLKAPVTESNPSGERAKRQNSFCSRMCGMKRVNTGASTAKDPDSRINKSLRKWNCKCSSAFEFGAFVCGYMDKRAGDGLSMAPVYGALLGAGAGLAGNMTRGHTAGGDVGALARYLTGFEPHGNDAFRNENYDPWRSVDYIGRDMAAPAILGAGAGVGYDGLRMLFGNKKKREEAQPEEKQAMPRGLQDIPSGHGPDQIEDAILRYNQLRALVRPDDSTLKQYGLGRPAFQQALRKITSHSQDKDRFELRKVAPNPGLHAAVAGISSLALPAAAGYFGGPQAALATLPISGAAAGAAYVNASMKREGVKRTAKLLKQYGLLNPQLLRQAYPLLGDDYRIA